MAESEEVSKAGMKKMRREPKLLLSLGAALITLGASLSTLYLINIVRVWLGYVWLPSLFIGLALFIGGIIYIIPWKSASKVIMGMFLALVNLGFMYALWLTYSIPPTVPLHYDYLSYVKFLVTPTWLVINVIGSYYFLVFLRRRRL